MIIDFRRQGAGWIGSKLIRGSDAHWTAVELRVVVEARIRNGRPYPHSFSATLRRCDGGGEISLLLTRRCSSLTNVAWQIERNGWATELSVLDRERRP